MRITRKVSNLDSNHYYRIHGVEIRPHLVSAKTGDGIRESFEELANIISKTELF